MSKMTHKDGAFCIVIRDSKILLIRQRRDGREYYGRPGGGIEPGETPEQAAIRELWEECNVTGKIIKSLGTYRCPHVGTTVHSFQVDIGDQTPMLGPNLTEKERQIFQEIRWMAQDELCERDRAFLWTAGLAGVLEFFEELVSWGDDVSYPRRRG